MLLEPSDLAAQKQPGAESELIPPSFSVPGLNHEQLKDLSRLLQAEGYLKNLDGAQPHPPEATRQVSENLAALKHLFSAGEWLARETAEQVFSAARLETLLKAGLLREQGGVIRACFQIQVYQGFLFLADFMPQRHPVDLVLPIGPSGKFLAEITIRRAVKTALDLGCGCGLQAILLSRHAEKITATDLNPRAIALSRLNADLNNVDNIEFLQGSYFEPVKDRKFDLIVANLPYVITPEKKYLYRDTGEQLDHPVRENLQQIPFHLHEGGFAHVMLNWLHSALESWWQPVETWVSRRNVDAWLFYQFSMTPERYADLWILADKINNPEQFQQVKQAWLAWYAAQKVERIALGVITLRRRTASDNWHCSVRVRLADSQQLDEQIWRLFANQDFLAQIGAQKELLDRKLVPVDLKTSPGSEGFCRASTTSGFLIEGQITALSSEAVALLDGKTSVRAAIQQTATKNGQPIAAIEAAIVSDLVQLINLGMLKAND